MTANADGLRRAFVERANALAADAAGQMQQALENAAPLGQTGETRRRTSVTVVAPGSIASPSVMSEARVDTDYASYVEEGTPPHEIRPRGPWPLRFTIPGSGQVVTVIVHHPGITGTHWFANTLAAEWSPALGRALNRV